MPAIAPTITSGKVCPSLSPRNGYFLGSISGTSAIILFRTLLCSLKCIRSPSASLTIIKNITMHIMKVTELNPSMSPASVAMDAVKAVCADGIPP